MPASSILAPAKINLFLHITGKRADGYHLLESLVAFAAIGDQLEITPAGDLSLTVSGPYASSIDSDNIVLGAAHMLQQLTQTTQGAAIHLHKNLPVGAGMGGGSADAAATLRGLAQLWGVHNPELLRAIAMELGSDIVVCLESQPCIMRGIGESLEPASLPTSLPVVLVNPNQPLLTKDVFSAYTLSQNPSPSRGEVRRGAKYGTDVTTNAPTPALPLMGREFKSILDVTGFLYDTRNDLQIAATQKMPLIGDMIEALSAQSGALLARMTGSGATCFCLFATQNAANIAAETLARDHPNWWVAATNLQATNP